MCPRSSNSPALQVANLGWPSKRPKVAQGSTKGKHTLQECLDVLVYNTDLSCVMAGLAPAPKKRKHSHLFLPFAYGGDGRHEVCQSTFLNVWGIRPSTLRAVRLTNETNFDQKTKGKGSLKMHASSVKVQMHAPVANADSCVLERNS